MLIDIIPNCTNKIDRIFRNLGISASKQIGHVIDLDVEKHRLFLQKLDEALACINNQKLIGSKGGI